MTLLLTVFVSIAFAVVYAGIIAMLGDRAPELSAALGRRRIVAPSGQAGGFAAPSRRVSLA